MLVPDARLSSKGIIDTLARLAIEEMRPVISPLIWVIILPVMAGPDIRVGRTIVVVGIVPITRDAVTSATAPGATHVLDEIARLLGL